MKAFFALCLLGALALASATCPNLCNGHGTCGDHDRCSCFSNWMGADCSERVCSYGLAWVDAPTATNEAHKYAECSNKGICDRSTGKCECFPGYEGKGCRRSTCPNSCSGHGTCYLIDALKSDPTDPTGRKLIRNYGDIDSFRNDQITYTSWDAKKIQGCVCDPYYEGVDCSSRMCPRGDNRLTTGNRNENGQVEAKDQGNTIHEIIIAQPTATAALAGEFTLTFKDLYGGSWETDVIMLTQDGASGTPFSVNAIRDRVKEELENLPNDVIESVSVTSVACGTGTGTSAPTACTDDPVAATSSLCGATSGLEIPNGRLNGGYLGFDSGFVSAADMAGADYIFESEDSAGTIQPVSGDYGTTGQCLDLKIEFTGDQNVGVQNLLEVNYRGCDYDGCAPRYKGISDSDFDGTAGKRVFVYVADVTSHVDSGSQNKFMHKERAVCSEHGLCDSTTGLCTCFSGYYDEDCNKQTVLI